MALFGNPFYKKNRKTVQGTQFYDLASLIEWIDKGYWIYWKLKPCHPAVISALQLSMIRRGIREGQFFRCQNSKTNEPYKSKGYDACCSECISQEKMVSAL